MTGGRIEDRLSQEEEKSLSRIPLVGIILGSDSDLEVMAETARTLASLGVEYEVTIASAHRHPETVTAYARGAEERGLQVIIAGAGMAAHLPGVVAAQTNLPVIGVPLLGKTLSGQDALYSIVQMPPGVPVATVAINGARNAALLAAQILARNDGLVREKLVQYRRRLSEETRKKNERLQELGIEGYLREGDHDR